ncbi:MAG: NrdH-redoxin [Gammaproteobacteria bacterium]|nr:MAG: NrdH-redoxin [Gammaproteobacteria bacterium]
MTLAWRAFALLVLWLLANTAASYQPPPDTLEVYVRHGCPHCANAREWLPQWAERHPGIRIVIRQVDDDPTARDALIEVFEKANIWPPGVPAFVFQGNVVVGFEDPQHATTELDQLVRSRSWPAPLAVIPKREDAAPAPPYTPSATELARWQADIKIAQWGLPAFVLGMGLLDGFNPCAMWVLLFLLSLLVHMGSRRRMALVAGTFVAVSGAMYFLFMAAWLNLFLAIGLTQPVQWLLAGIALVIGLLNLRSAWQPQTRVRLAIPDAAKRGIYARVRTVVQADSLPLAIAAVSVLAILVNFVELLCTAGLPALTTAIITQHTDNPFAYYAYLGIYILGYIADDSLMVAIAVIAMSQRKLSERGGRWLKLLSGLVMAGLGIVMLLRPDWVF